jgi:hypothetical protein
MKVFITYDGLREGGMELEDNLFDKIRDVLVIVESSNITRPSIRLSLIIKFTCECDFHQLSFLAIVQLNQ